MALRVNTETAGSVGSGQMIVGVAHYQDAGGAAIESRASNDARADQTLLVQPQLTVSQNGAPFPVSPGMPFTLSVPIGAAEGLAHAAYVAVIFLDAGGHGLKRLEIPATPTRIRLPSLRTDGRGSYRQPAPFTLTPKDKVGADYAGDGERRGAAAVAD
ncbi:MAG: hypothetical protein JWO83_5021 [Caulobacteraceae bacterium]|nr:hypothetical protein [Caulobacteraceae bacterium]